MRIVFDTNVLIGAVAADGLCRQIVRKRAPAHAVITSALLVDELRDKLRTKFRVAIDDYAFLTFYLQHAELVDPQPLPAPVCRDAEDDWVLATALAGRAEIIVTGDDDLLVLKRHRGVRILSPRGFLEFLDRHP